MKQSEAIQRANAAPVGRLATINPDGLPHLVPVTFALVDGAAVHMIDHKPKTTQRLQRVANIESRPEASLLVDHYNDDWSRLWWVRLDGKAHLATSGSEWRIARKALIEKYAQYQDSPPTGQAIYLDIDNVVGWTATA
jgi:PPOX class probable F420-dependent enzyme